MKKKKLFAAAAMSLAILMSVSLSGCGESKNNDNSVVESSDTSEEKEPTTYGTIEWPSDGLGSFIPVPISKTGEIMWDSSDSFLAVIAKTSKSDFSKYINKCKDKGFSIDCLESDTGYMAENRDGYKVTLIFEDDNTMNVSVDAPDDESSNKESSKKEQSSKKQESKKEESSKKESSKEEKSDSDTVTPSFKEMMDEYEEFMDKYVDFSSSSSKFLADERAENAFSPRYTASAPLLTAAITLSKLPAGASISIFFISYLHQTERTASLEHNREVFHYAIPVLFF